MTVFLGAGITDMSRTWLPLLYFEIPVSFAFFNKASRGSHRLSTSPFLVLPPLPFSPPSPPDTTQDHFHLGEQVQAEGLPTSNI